MLRGCDQTIDVFGKECVGVKPKAGKNLGALETVGAARQVLELVLTVFT